ncbi:MAG: PDZ domain-containing protein [Firmicutes bacterium]|nr:PDZ domain-containing protein [Bacillota bacterium]
MRKRRGLWWKSLLWVVAALAVILGGAWFVPVQEIAFAPGITGNLASMVHVRGKRAPTPGRLLMVAIDVMPANALIWALAHVDNAYALYPSNQVLPPGMTMTQYINYNNALMSQSQEDAMVAGERLAGLPAKVVVEPGLLVAGVLKTGSAYGRIQVGDQIMAVNGTPISFQNLRKVLGQYRVGQTVRITYLQRGVRHVVALPLRRVPNDPVPGIGIVATEKVRYVVPRPVRINAGPIGGPSAGMMFSLEIYSQITGRNLAHGRIVAGTGEITPNGRVLEIGGVRQKVITVYRAGARVFLCPKANYASAEAMARARGYHLTIYPVTTLAQALADLTQSS